MASINLSDLPLKYQQQILTKIVSRDRRRVAAAAKYGNVKTTRGSLRFDSKKEAARFDELAAMQGMGQIKDLRMQVEFILQPAYTTMEGERVRAIRYLADFTYYRRSGNDWTYVVEDVKSSPTRTRTYLMKKKMMMDRLGLSITEI